ncbi:MAG TPA: iron-containing redox enzyme family protein [Ramlibacter sp.]|nr:iron-containing redox enzyme family protein [Ramlibacter sp.]
MSTFTEQLQGVVDAEWARIQQGRFWRLVMEQPVVPGLYRDLMLQVYHYSRHNSMNQAACAFLPAPEGLLRFVYRHAAEELGHERMVVHDLKTLDLLREGDLEQAPLPATEALIGYLYSVSIRYGAIARLGYSFWAEAVYDHIAQPLGKITRDLKLTRQSLTFFGSHAEADAEHIKQVSEAIERFAITPADQARVLQVARTTLFLTGQLVDQVADLHAPR